MAYSNAGSNKPLTTLKDLASGELFDGGLNNVLEYWWSKKSIGIHTQIPARITKLNLEKNSVTVQPLINTFFTGERTIQFPQLEDIPLSIISANNGIAKLTMPVKVKDIGMLFFSERDPSNWLNTEGQNIIDPFLKENLSAGTAMYPILFQVGMFTPSSAISYDPVNIVMNNDKSFVILHPNGKIEGRNDISSFILGEDGTNTLTNGSSTITQQSGTVSVTAQTVNIEAATNITGATNINGAMIGTGGNLVTAQGTNLDQLKTDFDAHVHGGGTLSNGQTSGVIL